MRIVTFNCEVKIDIGKHRHGRTVTMPANVPNVMATIAYNSLMKDSPELANVVTGTSVLETRIRPFCAVPGGGHGQSVLFYTGAGGLGDQVMAWPAARWLHEQGYKVSVLADAGNDACWRGFDWVRSVVVLPAPLPAVMEFDHHAIFEVVTNVDSLPDQRHPTDSLLHRLGASADVSATLHQLVKRVDFKLSMRDLSRRWSDRPYGVFHLAATNSLRSLPAEEVYDVASSLVKAKPELDWLGVCDESNAGYHTMELPAGFRKVSAGSFSELVALAKRAEVGVGPDSLMMHLFGVLGRPFVAYFGPIPPELRTRHYQSVRAIYAHGACQLAPCFALSSTTQLPGNCPTKESGYCAVAIAGCRHLAAQAAAATR